MVKPDSGHCSLIGCIFIFFLALDKIGGWFEFATRQADRLHVAMSLASSQGSMAVHLFLWDSREKVFLKYHENYRLSPVVKHWGIAIIVAIFGLVLFFW